MKQPFVTLKDEKGIALLTAIMLLVILTIIGLAAVNTMQTERDIAAGETAYRIGFYMADSGISYARTLEPDDVPEGLNEPITTIPSDANFTLMHIRTYQDKTGDDRFVVESTSKDTTGTAGTVTIQAEIKFPTETAGRELDDGSVTTY
ncbi:MAG: hypothetical protein GY749_04500 [Desulfobacteraceae bacterium]|nr:hypothetical protein [Desulfobacteraceae bacterium]